MTYLCYRNWQKGILPGVTRNLPAGEKIVIEAFIYFEDEQKGKAMREIGESGMSCPYVLLNLL
ncbi:MAG: hypothetical protein N2484_09460 [Clostridia bacterium]|nr:hypothetical protein [Clostridia bacterium]